MMQNKEIVLCSGSPRRQDLLNELGIKFKIQIKEVDEIFPDHLKAEKVAIYLAEKKAAAFENEIERGTIYITADTIVWIHDEVLGKPADANEALHMLKKLSGTNHQVFTAVCLNSDEHKKLFCVKSEVRFKNLNEEEIKQYVEHYKPFDKAGAYGAQECLPEGMNPCSAEENNFLKLIGKTDLFEKTLPKNKKHMPIITGIAGSYFNVMGLPVVELYQELEKWK